MVIACEQHQMGDTWGIRGAGLVLDAFDSRMTPWRSFLNLITLYTPISGMCRLSPPPPLYHVIISSTSHTIPTETSKWQNSLQHTKVNQLKLYHLNVKHDKAWATNYTTHTMGASGKLSHTTGSSDEWPTPRGNNYEWPNTEDNQWQRSQINWQPVKKGHIHGKALGKWPYIHYTSITKQTGHCMFQPHG
jgi:hypothetical protein